MKAVTIIKGDWSVGIPDLEIKTEIGMDLEPDERIDFKQALNEFYSNYFDGRSDTIFDDECHECRELISKDQMGICSNPRCVMNFEDLD